MECVHCKRQTFTLYIGRPSKWGNPFTHLPNAVKPGMTLVKDRDEACDRYREWIQTQQNLMNALKELDNQVLGCWCHPKRCHGHELIVLRRKQLELLR